MKSDALHIYRKSGLKNSGSGHKQEAVLLQSKVGFVEPSAVKD